MKARPYHPIGHGGGANAFFLFMVNRIIKMPPQLFSLLFVSPMKCNAQRVGGGSSIL